MKILCYIVLFLGATTSLAQQTIEEVLLRYNTQSIPYIYAENLVNIQNESTIEVLETMEEKD